MQKNEKAGKPVLEIVINNTTYLWSEQYITGDQIRKVAGIKGDDKLYLRIQEPWKDELILNNTSVNLAREGIENFYSLENLQFSVNGKLYSWPDQFIKGSEIRKIAGIDEDDKIYLDNDDPYIDKLIGNDDEVDLARPTVEHFYTIPVDFEVTIIVSGAPHKWNHQKISYKEVIILAYGSYNNSPTMVYTVGYEDGPKQNPDGSMSKDAIVYVKNKMIFHATATDKS